MYDEQAFPRTVTEWNPDSEKREVTSEGGMTLRDYFAANAMQAIVNAAIQKDGAGRQEDAGPIAEAAYFMADAMLAARERT